MTPKPPPQQPEVEELRARLEEAQETLRAIHSGEVDAIVVTGPKGEQVYTLKGAEEPYRVMVEAMTEGAVTFSPDGTILYCNARFAELIKSPLEQAIGSDLRRFIVPDDLPALDTLLHGRLGKCVRRKLGLLARDETTVPVHLSASPLRNGEFEAIAAVITDLTAVEAAAAARSHLAMIVDSSDDAIISKSLDGVITSWNKGAERMYGYTANEAIGQSMSILVPPGYQNEFSRILESIRSGQHVRHFETVRKKKNGEEVQVSLSISPISDAGGNIVGAAMIARDITERKRAEEELRQHREHLEDLVRQRTAQLEASNRELEGFAYSMSHDLRVPLRAIDGFSRLLLRQYEERLDEEGRRLLRVVCDNTARMGRMIDDILDFSRAGRLGLRISETDMGALVREAWQELAPSVANREVRLNAGPLPKAQGDPDMLLRVWANLLGNALKFTQPRPMAQIDIEGKIEGAECIYCIRDNGVGFDQQYADKLFGVFQRLHGVAEFEGTGIGLAIVKRIVTRHGGRVWAEGKPGEGAAFYFSLPIERKEPS